MSRLKLDMDTLGLSSLLEKLAGVQVKDCFKEGETIYYVVGSGELGKALGRGGVIIHKLQDKLNQRVRVIEFQDNLLEFVKKVIYPLQPQQILEEENYIIIHDDSKKTKSLLIGRDGRNLKVINRAVQRFFNKEVRIR